MSKGCKFISLGDGSSAFLCMGKPDHECDDKGPVILIDSEGKTHVQPENEEDRIKLYESVNITSGSVSCSICGRTAIQDAFYI